MSRAVRTGDIENRPIGSICSTPVNRCIGSADAGVSSRQIPTRSGENGATVAKMPTAVFNGFVIFCALLLLKKR
jgi:hypothetical protein